MLTRPVIAACVAVLMAPLIALGQGIETTPLAPPTGTQPQERSPVLPNARRVPGVQTAPTEGATGPGPAFVNVPRSRVSIDGDAGGAAAEAAGTPRVSAEFSVSPAIPGLGALPAAVPLPEETASEAEADQRTLPGSLIARREGAETDDGSIFLPAPPGSRGAAPRVSRPISLGATEEAPAAVVRVLDMIAGRTDTFTVSAGEMTDRGRLRIQMLACDVPVSGSSVGHVALLRIWDRKEPRADPDFSGWMFAESPALSAFDHPRYDVWLISCTTALAEASGGSE